MEGLTKLLAPLHSGKSLLDALKSSQLSDSILPGLIAEVVTEAQASGNRAGPTAAPIPTPGSTSAQETALSSIDQLSFVNPRGKHDLRFGQTSFTVSSAKTSFTVPYAAITNLLILDAVPQDTKDKVYVYLSISEAAGLQQGKAPLRSIVLVSTASTQLTARHPREPGQELQGLAAVVLCQLFGLMGVPSDRFGSPDPAVFRSMIQQKSGIPAHIKAKAGVLFPLPAALCFLETPALLIPLDNIKCMELARAGGNSATFDVIVHHKDGRLTEFGMLPREELGPLESYMMTRKIKLGDGEEESASGSEAGSQGGAAGESCGSDESDDEDFDPASSASEEGSGNESDASSDGAEVVSEDDVPSATLRKVMEAEARPTKRKRG